MPIYEYICSRCGYKFEELVHSSKPEVECPICHSNKVDKCFSLFSSSGASSCDTPTGGG